MAIPIGGLVTGLTRALTGYTGGRMAGQQQARQDAIAEQERQRQARQSLLAQQLIEAQMGNYQSLAQDRQRAAASAQAQQRAIAEAAARIRAMPDLDPQLGALPDEDLVEAIRTQATQREPAPSYGLQVSPLTGEAFTVNQRTGEVKSSGTNIPQKPVTPAGGQRLTEGERRAAGLFVTAEDAYNRLRSAQAPNLKDYLAGKVPLGLGQASISARQQVQNQAGAQFYRSYLYLVSGATVNDKEADEAAKTFTPQWGDDPELVKEKLKVQTTMLRAMRTVMGRAQPSGESGDGSGEAPPPNRYQRFRTRRP